ncbi:MAG: hypothetical protein GY754_25785 [bacterium]|nr:hypothetical protein [bacterium]
MPNKHNPYFKIAEELPMKLLARLIPALLIGGAVSALFFILFEAGFFLTAAAGLAGFVGGALLFSPKKIDPRLLELEKVHGISAKTLRSIISKGKRRVAKMQKIASSIEEKSVRQKIDNICETVEKIFEDFKYDPKDVKAARQFLSYYLDTTIKIIEQYSVLSKQPTSADGQKTLAKAEEMLGKIEEAFEKQLTKLYEDDFLDLDTEMTVLDSAIKFDGLRK